jgi:hypothetical protein
LIARIVKSHRRPQSHLVLRDALNWFPSRLRHLEGPRSLQRAENLP